MADSVLIHADSIRSPEMRHEVPVAVRTPSSTSSATASAAVVVTAFEIERISKVAPDIETLPPEHFGIDELLADGMPAEEAALEVYVRACQELGVTSAVAPPTFPLELADHLRANGIEVDSDRALFEGRRRKKNPTELAGLRRAQRACEAALDVARGMLREAEIVDGALVLAGEPLTCERLKIEIERVFSAHGAFADEFIVAHGAQGAVGHDMGSGRSSPARRSSSTSSRATARPRSSPT